MSSSSSTSTLITKMWLALHISTHFSALARTFLLFKLYLTKETTTFSKIKAMAASCHTAL